MFVLATPAFSFEVDDTDLSSLVVCDCHLAHLLDVCRSKDQVLHCGNGPIDTKVLPGLLQTDMLETYRYGFELAKREVHLRLRLHFKFVTIRASICSGDRRVVAHLLADVFEFWADVLVGFTQDWIEWLARALRSASVLCCTESCNQHEANLRIGFLVCPYQHSFILHDLGNLLDH